MKPERFVITDDVWANILPVLSGKPVDCGVRAKDTDYFLKPYCGVCAQAPRGEICRMALGIGTVLSVDFDSGRSEVFLIEYLSVCRETQILNMP